MDELKPDWELFRDTEYTLDTHTDQNTTECLVCGSEVHKKGKKLCSPDCVRVYQDHKNAPHDPLFTTIFHQMRYEESLSKINH